MVVAMEALGEPMCSSHDLSATRATLAQRHLAQHGALESRVKTHGCAASGGLASLGLGDDLSSRRDELVQRRRRCRVTPEQLERELADGFERARGHTQPER